MDFVWLQGDDCRVKDALALRMEVFVTEQGFSAEGEVDALDAQAQHIVGYENGKALCCARLFPEQNGEWHVGRIVVKKSLRGQGVGRQMMQQVAERAKQQGGTSVILGAQHDKEPFYISCGYEKFGEPFLDENYPHVWMRKIL